MDAPSQIEVVPLLDDAVGAQRRSYLLLFGAVCCVLLIAGANIANLDDQQAIPNRAGYSPISRRDISGPDAIQRVHLGFDPAGVVTFDVLPTNAKVREVRSEQPLLSRGD